MGEDEICKTLKIEMPYEYKDDTYNVGTWNETNSPSHKFNSSGDAVISKTSCIYLR
jgi:hypothetical protein